MGPTPKRVDLRQRRNRAASRAVLPAEGRKGRIPPLPHRPRGKGAWDQRVRAWWALIWRSPMAAQWIASDIPQLHMLAELMDQFWKKPDYHLMAEMRQQAMRFGFSPLDRRRLEWSIEDDLPGKPQRVVAAASKDDPRTVLTWKAS